MSQEYDPTVKTLVETDPAAWPVLIGQPWAPTEVIDADIATVSGAADKVLHVHAADPYLLHLEFVSGQSLRIQTSSTQLNLVVLIWGVTSIIGKLITIDAVAVTVWRTGLAALGLALICIFSGISLRVSRRFGYTEILGSALPAQSHEGRLSGVRQLTDLTSVPNPFRYSNSSP